MEKLLIKSNGQWDLIKSDEGHKARADWISEAPGTASAKYKIPKMEGELRNSALKKLAEQTESRKGITGETEYLLHRGGSGVDREHKPDEITSWTPVQKYAHRQAYYEDTPGKVSSAWIPESQLYSGLAHYDYEDPQIHRTAQAEQEWLVSHDKQINIHSSIDAQNPRTIKN